MKRTRHTPIDNHALTNAEIAAQYSPMLPIAFVRSYSPDGTPCGVVTCWNVQAILYAVEHANPLDTVAVQAPDVARFIRCAGCGCDLIRHPDERMDAIRRCKRCWLAWMDAGAPSDSAGRV